MNGEFVIASVAEFLKMWGSGGHCTLTLKASGGLATVALECALGPPGGLLPQGSPPPHPPTGSPSQRGPHTHTAPPPQCGPTQSPFTPHPPTHTPAPPPRPQYSHPPSPFHTPHSPRHRGPGDRERLRRRAVRHQAELTSSSSPLQFGSVTSTSPSPYPLSPKDGKEFTSPLRHSQPIQEEVPELLGPSASSSSLQLQAQEEVPESEPLGSNKVSKSSTSTPQPEKLGSHDVHTTQEAPAAPEFLGSNRASSSFSPTQQPEQFGSNGEGALEPDKDEDYQAVLEDPSFLTSVLQGLPGVATTSPLQPRPQPPSVPSASPRPRQSPPATTSPRKEAPTKGAAVTSPHTGMGDPKLKARMTAEPKVGNLSPKVKKEVEAKSRLVLWDSKAGRTARKYIHPGCIDCHSPTVESCRCYEPGGLYGPDRDSGEEETDYEDQRLVFSSDDDESEYEESDTPLDIELES